MEKEREREGKERYREREGGEREGERERERCWEEGEALDQTNNKKADGARG